MVHSDLSTYKAREDDNSQPEKNIVTTTFIDVTVLDVNDEAPEFSKLPEAVEIIENSPTNTALNLGVTVTDRDTVSTIIELRKGILHVGCKISIHKFKLVTSS